MSIFRRSGDGADGEKSPRGRNFSPKSPRRAADRPNSPQFAPKYPSPESPATIGRKKFGGAMFPRRPSAGVLSPPADLSLEQMQRPISEWTPEIAVAKLTLLLDKPYRGMPLNGKELQNLPESEKERQKILNCGKSEMWKILDMVAAEKANERKSLQQFELDLVTPPMLPEEDNDRRAKLYAVHNDPKERQASLDSRSEASRIVSEIFRSDSIDMGESAATTMTITMEVPSEDAPLPPAPAHQPRALVVKAVNNEEEEEEDLEEDEEEDGMGDEQLQDETNAPSDGKRKPRPRPPPPLEDSNDVIIISKLDKVTF